MFQIAANKKNRRGEVKECCRGVFCDWLEQEGGGNYPVTWQGLFESGIFGFLSSSKTRPIFFNFNILLFFF